MNEREKEYVHREQMLQALKLYYLKPLQLQMISPIPDNVELTALAHLELAKLIMRLYSNLNLSWDQAVERASAHMKIAIDLECTPEIKEAVMSFAFVIQQNLSVIKKYPEYKKQELPVPVILEKRLEESKQKPDLSSLLFRYVENNDLKKLDDLLSSGLDANIKDLKGNTALFFVKSKEAAEILFSYDAFVNAINSSGKTSLHVAHSAEVAECLMVHSANVIHQAYPDDKIMGAQMPIHTAISSGNFPVVKYLARLSPAVIDSLKLAVSCFSIFSTSSPHPSKEVLNSYNSICIFLLCEVFIKNNRLKEIMHPDDMSELNEEVPARGWKAATSSAVKFFKEAKINLEEKCHYIPRFFSEINPKFITPPHNLLILGIYAAARSLFNSAGRRFENASKHVDSEGLHWRIPAAVYLQLASSVGFGEKNKKLNDDKKICRFIKKAVKFNIVGKDYETLVGIASKLAECHALHDKSDIFNKLLIKILNKIPKDCVLDVFSRVEVARLRNAWIKEKEAKSLTSFKRLFKS